jgi:hypothetical protein
LKRERSISKKSIRDKITITYGQPYLVYPHYGNTMTKDKNSMPSKGISSGLQSNLNKSYDSVLKYKKRFIERKP